MPKVQNKLLEAGSVFFKTPRMACICFNEHCMSSKVFESPPHQGEKAAVVQEPYLSHLDSANRQKDLWLRQYFLPFSQLPQSKSAYIDAGAAPCVGQVGPCYGGLIQPP